MPPPPLDNLAVVLVETRNPLNIGAVARAMSNFGCFSLRLVEPYDFAFQEAVSAVGAKQLLLDATIHATVAEAVADCTLVVGATGSAHRMPLHPYHRLEKAGRLLRLQEAGWSIDYDYGDNPSPQALPVRLTARRGEALELKLRIDDWSAQ